MEDVVRHLITAAADTDESVRLSARLALCDAGRARPDVVCTNIARYLQQGQKGADEQRIQVLRALEQLARQIGGELAQGQAQELVAVVAKELTSNTVQSKNRVAWRDAACDAVVAVGSSHPQMIVEKLLEHIDPGTLPPDTVVRALGKLAQGHPALFVPRLKEVLMRLLPLLSSVRNSGLRIAVGKALTSFCEAVITVATGGESAAGPPAVGAAGATPPDLGAIADGPAAEYHSELFSAYEVVLGNWTTARESEVRGATAEALGYIASLLRADQFSAAAVRLLQLHVGLLRGESNDAPARVSIARGICQVLRRCASPAGQSVLSESAPNLMGALHPLVGAAPDYASPSSAKAHAELLRAFEIMATGFPSTVVQFLASRLEAPEPSARVVTCTILKHLANSCRDLLAREGLRGQVVSIVQPLCQDDALATRAALAQLTVALGSAGFLDVAGGDSLVWFVIHQAATPEEEARAADKAAKGAKGRTVTHTQLRLMCARMVSHLANVAPGPVRPLLFEALVLSKYRHALGALCDALVALAEDASGSGDQPSGPLIDLASDVNLPKPQALAARLFVAAFAPDRGAGLGRSALRALRHCATTISPRLAGSAATEAVARLPEYWETLDLRRYEPAVSEADVRAAWQREVVEACRTWLRCISDEAWAMRLGEELRLQLALHEGDATLRAASFLLLGAAVAHTRHKEFARDTVTATLTAVDHASAEEAEAAAAGVGLAACADHVDLVLETVCTRQRQASNQRRSTGFFGFGASGPSEEEVAREKATLARCLGQIALRAPRPLLASRLESQIVPALLPLFQAASDRTLRAALTDAAAHLGRAAARGGSGGGDGGGGGEQGPAALTPVSATPLPHRTDLLAALRGSLRSGVAAAKKEAAKRRGRGQDEGARKAAEALQATLRACASLAALPPTLTAEEAAPLYDGTVELLTSLPYRDDGGAAEEEEEEQQPALSTDCDASAPLIRSATAVLRSALRQDSGAEGFAAALERLRPAATADSPVTRLRATHALCVLSRDLVARVSGERGAAAEAVAVSPLAAADGTGLADGAASLLPRAAGALLPRLGDTVVEVREQALAALAELLCVHDATAAGDAEAVAPSLSGEAGASILRRLRGAERAERAAALREAARAVAATTGARDLAPLLSALMAAVTGPDPEAGDAAAQCLVALLGSRGEDSAVDVLVPTLVDGLVAALRDIPRTGSVLLGGSRLETARAHAELATLAALRTLAAAHFSAVGDHLFASPLPLAPEVVRVLRALAKGEGPAEAAAGAGAEGDARSPRLRALVEQITDLLNTSAVFEGGEDGGSSLVHCALAALTALLSSPDGLMEPFVARHFAPLFCTLLLAAGSIYAAKRAGVESSDAATDAVAAVRQLLRCAKADAMLATFDGRPAAAAAGGGGAESGRAPGSAPCDADDEEMGTVQHEAAAALAQAALMPGPGDATAAAAGGDAATAHGGGDGSVTCAELLSGEDVQAGVTQMVAALGRHHPRQAAPVQAVMTSFLERPNAGHRAVAAAVVAHLLGMSVEAATQGSAPEELLASVKPGPLASALMARLSDKEAPVRIQAVTGLASLAPMWSAEAGDALADLGVQAGTLAGAIVSAAGDAAEDVACAALDSLTKLLAALPASDVQVARVNVCFRLKASVTRPHAGVRESAFRLWHCLCSGARADRAALQDDAHTLLPCLLVHVRDQRGSVRRAASRALAATATVLEPAGEEMRSVLVRHGAVDESGEPQSPVQDFDALAADVVTLAAQRFPQRITGYLTGALLPFAAKGKMDLRRSRCCGARPACSELLQDAWARTRASAAVVAAAIVGQLSERERTRTNAASIVKTLTALLTSDDDDQVRARVAQALGKLAA